MWGFEETSADIVEKGSGMGFNGKPTRKTKTHQAPKSMMDDGILNYCPLLLESVSDAIIITGLDFVIAGWNQAAEKIYGWRAEDAIGKPVTEVVPTTYIDTPRDEALRQLSTAGVWRGEVIQQHRDGTPLTILASVNQLKDESGKPMGVVAINRDITERKRTEQALQESQRTLSTLMSNLPGIAYRCRNDRQWTMLFVSQGCAELTGYAPEDLIQNHTLAYADVIHPDDRETVWHTIQNHVAVGQPFQVNYRIVSRDGTEKWVWELGRRVELPDGTPVLEGFITDITERHQAEEAQHYYATRLKTLHDIDRAILSAQAPQEIAQIALKHIYQIIEPFRLSILELDPHAGSGRVLATSTRSETQLGEGTQVLLKHIVGYHDLVQGHAVQIEDLAELVPTPIIQTLVDEGVRAVLNVPLFAQEKLVGLLALGCEQTGLAFAQNDIDILREIGDQIAVAIVQARLREAEHEHRVLAEMLGEMAHTVNHTLEPDEVLKRVIAAVERVFPHSGAHILLTEQDGAVARVVQSCACYVQNALPEPDTNSVITIADNPVLSYMRDTGQALAILNVMDYPGWVNQANHAWVRSYAGAPIRSEDKVLGFLNLESATLGFFTASQAHYLHAFANQAALALQNARLYQELGSYSAYLEQAVAERTAELQESEERFRAVVEDQTELICRFTAEGKLTFVNEAYCRYFDKPCQELVGHSFLPQIPRVDRSTVQQQLAALRPDNPIVTVEHRVFAPNGELRWVEWTNRLLVDTRSNVTEIQAAGRDITERKQAEHTLRQALEREMELGDMRMRFLSIASHDLRNPLAVIQSGIDMLEKYRGRMSEERKETKFKQIRTSITHMVELLDDVLIIGRAEAGKLTFNPKPVELETFCHNIVAEIQTSIGTEHEFDFRLTGTRVTRPVDPKLLRHILYNLLSNAVKYSPANSTITFALTFDADQTVFRIQDEGIGIPATDQPHLFEAFHRASNVGTTSGTGLGLSIVKRSVELHGGTVQYHTQEGVGTTFTISLPHRPPS